MNSGPRIRKKNRLQLLHQYYTYTGFYTFLWDAMKKAIPPILIFVGILLIINYWVIDINTALAYVTANYSSFIVLGVFFLSESFLGIIPPELFIAWSEKTNSPLTMLSILAALSYTGGIISYFLGKAITRIPSVHNYVEVKMAKHIKNTRKWGGFLIVVGALLPIPFSMTSIAAGIIKYGFGHFLLFGLLRFLRFYLYAFAIYSLL